MNKTLEEMEEFMKNDKRGASFPIEMFDCIFHFETFDEFVTEVDKRINNVIEEKTISQKEAQENGDKYAVEFFEGQITGMKIAQNLMAFVYNNQDND